MPINNDASLVLYHHPFTRAGTALIMLEEANCEYALRYVDLSKGEHKQADRLTDNPMGKVPILVDDGQVVTESAAIGLYLADRYAPGVLAPALNNPARGSYFRWACFAPSVLEPAAYAESKKWDVTASSAGWGRYADVLDTISAALAQNPSGPWLLGEKFLMSDVILGATLQFLIMFKMVEVRPEFTAYVEALAARPAVIRAKAINEAVIAQQGLGRK